MQPHSPTNPNQLQSNVNEANDETRFRPRLCQSAIVSDDEYSSDEAEIQVMDGMVEYFRPSPKSTNTADVFGDSSTFNFALTMTALGEDDRDRLAGKSARMSSRRGTASTRAPADRRDGELLLAPERLEQEGPKCDSDVNTALRFYINQSSLEYLPQRHVASTLLEKYFMAIHPIWPFLVEDQIRDEFDKTWSSNDVPSQIWMTQLNLIFALACQLWESNDGAPLANIYEAGRMFYLRASGFVIAHSHSLCSIPMLQTLLLAAQYQQGTMRSNECWLTIGTATRMAIGLDLHTSARCDRLMSAVDKELGKRLWWGCCSLDR